MKIVDIRLGLLRVPLVTPFRTALRSVEAIEDVIVSVHTDDGRIGYGGAAPTPPITGDSRDSIVAAIRQHIAPRLLGRDGADLNRNCTLVQTALERNVSAKAAVEIALYDLWAQRHDAPLYRMLGGHAAAALTTDITISVGAVDTMVAASLAALAQGYDVLKVKLGQQPELDIARVEAIHAAVAGRARLRLDPNQAWSPQQAVDTLRTLEAAGIAPDLLEQPVQAADIDGLAYVSARIATPVMADESVFSPQQALELLRRRAVAILNIKLMKTGGLRDALRIADLAALHGVQCMIGCMLESSVSAAAAAHLAVARSEVIGRIDLDGPALARFDPVVGGVHFDGPRIVLDDTPGLGIRTIDGVQPLPA
jgi:L-Ala-D/L-Glu epimerase